MNKMRIEKKISIKKKQTGILDLKNTITEWKIFQKRSTTDPTKQGKNKKVQGIQRQDIYNYPVKGTKRKRPKVTSLIGL